ncbi:MAG: hypothetical protein ACRDZT_02905 [Acidimicrobiales bacterium]
MFKRVGLGFACGYVLGARAGQQRYDQLSSAGRKVLELPGVRDLAADGQERTLETGRRFLSIVRERAGFGLDESDEGDDDGGEDEDETDDEADDDEAEDDVDGIRDSDEDDEYQDEEEDQDQDEGAEDGGGPKDGGRRSAQPKGEGRRSFASSIAELASAARDRGRVA